MTPEIGLGDIKARPPVTGPLMNQESRHCGGRRSIQIRASGDERLANTEAFKPDPTGPVLITSFM